MRFPTAVVAAAGLTGGYAVAAGTGNRALGGVVLAIGGGICAYQWYRNTGPLTASALLTTYVVAFGVSHPLAHRIGPWPSVLTVSAATAAAALVFADSKPSRRLAVSAG